MAKAKAGKIEAAPQGFFGNKRLVYGVLFVFAFLLYVNTIGHRYALDDLAVIETNNFVKKGVAGIPEICSTFYWKGSTAFYNANSGIYRPLSMIVFAVEYQLVGDTPEVFHFVNVLLYAFLAVLVYHVLAQLLTNYPRQLPFIATLIFIAHPLHTEVVANIKSLDEILSLIFSLLTLQAAMNYGATGKTKTLAWMLAFFFLALLSKEGALLFLFIVPLALHFFTTIDRRRLLIISGSMLGLMLAWLGLHEAIIHSDPYPKITYTYDNNSLLLAHGIAEQTASAFRILGRYLLLLFFPHPLSYNYSFNENPIVSWGDPIALLSLALWLGLFVFAVLQFKKKTILSFGILFTIITFSLTSNIFYLIGDTMAERLLFTPLLGFALCAAWLIMHFTKGLQTSQFRVHSNSLGIVMILVLPFAIKTLTRNPDWYDSNTLMLNDAEKDSDSGRIYYNQGVVLTNRIPPNAAIRDRYASADSAIAALKKAIRIDSGHSDWWFELGVAQYRRDLFDSSVTSFYTARRLNRFSDVDPNLADALYDADQYDSAVAVMSRVAKRKDGKPVMRTKIALLHMNHKDTLAGIAVLKEGINVDRANINNWIFLGNIYGMRKQYEDARRLLEEALTVQPGNKEVLRALVVTYRSLGNEPKAQEILRQYPQITQ